MAGVNVRVPPVVVHQVVTVVLPTIAEIVSFVDFAVGIIIRFGPGIELVVIEYFIVTCGGSLGRRGLLAGITRALDNGTDTGGGTAA